MHMYNNSPICSGIHHYHISVYIRTTTATVESLTVQVMFCQNSLQININRLLATVHVRTIIRKTLKIN